jgi:vitamin B12 transporter
MEFRRLAVAALAAAALAPAAAAQDAGAAPPAKDAPPPAEPPAEVEPLEVIATGFPRAKERATVPITTVDAAWFEEHAVTGVAEGLRQVPGAFVSRGGTPGAATSLFLRGAASNQVLVLQDGIPLNDPTVGNQFNFFDLDVLNLDRIEVLRGSYGALYGGSAIGGVVNLVSRRGEGQGTFRVSGEGGSFGTRRATVSGWGGDDRADWSFGIAESGFEGPRDRERFVARSFAGLFGGSVAGDGRAEVAVRWLDSEAQDRYDFGNPLPEDGNVSRERQLGAIGLTVEKPVRPWLTAKARLSVTNLDSTFRNGNDANPAATPEFVSGNRATTSSAGLSVRAEFPDGREGTPGFAVVAGAEGRSEESVGFSDSPFGGGLGIDRTTRNTAGYLLAEGRLGPVTVNGGGRLDDHSQGGTEWSPQAGVRVDVERTGTVLRGNYGEGFRPATPSEFTDPFVGNPDLVPERSVSWDAGVEQRIVEGVTAEATWFRLRTKDLIAFSGTTFLLENIARARNEGVETAVTADLGGGLRARAAYTRQRPRDDDTGARLANRPDSFASAGAEWTRGDWTLAADLYRQGAVDDLGQRGPDQDLRDSAGRRFLVNLAARWRASKTVAIFARVENLLDQEYVETPTAPRGLPLTVVAGVSVEF